ncbi:hypothetical protein Scep_023053 [Stephania cephalantha]|uniref:Uncharacterized protein n=1 Tax=Stephania cephalantha TaxID=152367 RepID=A0AAP0FJU8_9MAGN
MSDPPPLLLLCCPGGHVIGGNTGCPATTAAIADSSRRTATGPLRRSCASYILGDPESFALMYHLCSISAYATAGTLISVDSDEDLPNMIQAHDRLLGTDVWGEILLLPGSQFAFLHWRGESSGGDGTPVFVDESFEACGTSSTLRWVVGFQVYMRSQVKV